MPLIIQVTGWLVLLFLFVFLVLYPLIGVSYIEAKVIKIDRDRSTGVRITPPVGRLHVHHPSYNTITNEYGEFIFLIHGPVVPMTGVDVNFGDGNDSEWVALRAPIPFLSLFNSNLSTIYWVPGSSGDSHYFLDKPSAEKAFQASLQGAPAAAGELHDPGTGGRPWMTSAVHAATLPQPAGGTVRIRQIKADKTADRAYFEVRVNQAMVAVDGIPNENYQTDRMLSIEAGKPLQFSNFDIPLSPGSSIIQVKVFEKKRLFQSAQIASFDIASGGLTPADVGQPKKLQAGGAEVSYELLPPAAIGCAGINSRQKSSFMFHFWLDSPAEFADTITAVQYDLGGSPPKLISYPSIEKGELWGYTLYAFSPQRIRGKVVVQGGSSLEISTLCKAGGTGGDAPYFLALAYAYAGDSQPAPELENAERALGKDRNLLPAMLVRASALGDLKRFPDAIAQYRAALALPGRPPGLLNSYAWLLADVLPEPSSAQLAEARDLAAEAARKLPDGNNLDTLGWVDYKRHDYPSALKELESARDVIERAGEADNTSWQVVQFHLGQTLVVLNRLAEADRAFREVISFDQKYAYSKKEYAEKAARLIAKLPAK